MKSLVFVQKKIQSSITFFFLSLMYVVGIGITSVVAKMFGTMFITKFPKNSTWSTPQKSSHKTMY